METEENSESKNKTDKAKQGNRVDPNGLFNNPHFQEIIKHLLSGGGAVLVNYLFSIMPINGKIEELTGKNKKLEGEIAEIKEKLNELIDELNAKSTTTEENDGLHGNREYFRIPKKEGREISNKLSGHERR